MTTVTDPTAGADPGAIRALAANLQQVATTAGHLQADIGNSSTNWAGAAATGFEARLHELPGELGSISSSFHEASSALLVWASDVEGLQHEARTSMSAYSTAAGHLLTLQHAAPAPAGSKAAATAVAAQHDAQAAANNARASLNHVGQDFASRARVCKARIDAVAPHVSRNRLGALYHELKNDVARIDAMEHRLAGGLGAPFRETPNESDVAWAVLGLVQGIASDPRNYKWFVTAATRPGSTMLWLKSALAPSNPEWREYFSTTSPGPLGQELYKEGGVQGPLRLMKGVNLASKVYSLAQVGVGAYRMGVTGSAFFKHPTAAGFVKLDNAFLDTDINAISVVNPKAAFILTVTRDAATSKPVIDRTVWGMGKSVSVFFGAKSGVEGLMGHKDAANAASAASRLWSQAGDGAYDQPPGKQGGGW